jgi:AraC-like DNA-binding protein
MLHIHIPRPPLCEFVDVMCLSKDYRLAHRHERILPDGRMTLVINLREDALRLYDPGNPKRFRTTSGSLVSGARSQFHVIDTACQEFIMTAHFRPGGAFPFFGLPADELSEGDISLADLWGRGAGELREQLLEADTPAHKFGALERSLQSRLTAGVARHRAVAFAVNQFQRGPFPCSVSDVTEQLGLSQRQFIRRFAEEVGLTPKLFCRVRRFHEVLRVVSHASDVDWAQVALECGYYDQAHFIHDFRAFSGLNPTAYLTQRGEHLNHVPLRE